MNALKIVIDLLRKKLLWRVQKRYSNKFPYLPRRVLRYTCYVFLQLNRKGFTPKENFSVENSREFINILICILGKK